MVTQPPTSEPENASGVAATPSIAHPLHAFGGRDMDFRTEVALMAIVNRTPDSFYDRGRTFALDAAVHAGIEAGRNGARIIRMHDVRASRQALDIVACAQGWEEPRVLRHNMGDENTPEDIFVNRGDVPAEEQRADSA